MLKPKIIACALGMTALGVSFGLEGETSSPDPVEVTKVFRRSEWLKAGATGWKPAVVGTRLTAKESLKTLNNAYADMQLDPRNRFRLKENSILAIERLYHEEREADGSVVRLVELDLLKGDILARLDRLPAGTRLNLRSPVAIAAVRGTTFAVGCGAGDRTTRVSVSRGELRVGALGEPEKYVAVMPQQQTVVSPWSAAVLRAGGTGLPPKMLLMKRLEDPKVPLRHARQLVARLQNQERDLTSVVISAEVTATAPPDFTEQREAREWTIARARSGAQTQVIRKLQALRLSGDETIGDLMGSDPKMGEAIMAKVNTAGKLTERYDEAARSATARLELPLAAVREAVGRDIPFAWRSIEPVSLDDYAASFGGLIRAAAERAARVDAYRRLAEKIYGTVVNSTTTLKNFAVTNDQVEVAVKGLVQGAEEVSKTYYSDGSIAIVLQVSGPRVTNAVSPVTGRIFGTHYMATPTVLSATDFVDFLQADDL